MPSVAMKGGIFSLAMTTPEIAPISAPPMSAARMPSGNGKPALVRMRPENTAVRVIIVPTERSMPPEMMTKVQAVARTPLT